MNRLTYAQKAYFQYGRAYETMRKSSKNLLLYKKACIGRNPNSDYCYDLKDSILRHANIVREALNKRAMLRVQCEDCENYLKTAGVEWCGEDVVEDERAISCPFFTPRKEAIV